jgi:tRNA (adenine37-N6)-methyltransferase
MQHSHSQCTITPIGWVSSCWSEKFGIPKQPGLVPAAVADIEFHPPFAREELFRGLAGFSHIWVVFLFHDTLAEGWKPTVRPPRLGGQKRVGVFASRSPHRPNHLGMSVVRLERVVARDGLVHLEISGVDLLDGTPVIDIKPYVAYADSLPDARCGFTAEPASTVAVHFTEAADSFCRDYQQRTGRRLRQLIAETLAGDPRPASQRSGVREYGTLFWEVNVRWRATEDGFVVTGCDEASVKSSQ